VAEDDRQSQQRRAQPNHGLKDLDKEVGAVRQLVQNTQAQKDPE